ncbi:TetR/AcrR family transcriptional regulator [Marinospirillum sp.]|uniref:TetR/AcrR family transcriptional regulator n=1 Tax=Marinospirillum sp. TaxID=2183934 RepID=UPI00384F94D0
MPYAKDHKTRSRSRILQSAMELFARYGFKKVSISQIMKEARMTHGAFYAHFESKESLYSASFLELLKESGRARLVKAPLSIKKLIALASNYWNLRQQPDTRPGPETLLFNEVGNDNESLQPLLQSSYEDLRKLLERRMQALSRLQKLEVSSALIRDRARAILASLVGAITLARMLPDEEERQAILKVAQTQILAQMQLQTSGVSEH